MFKSFDFKEKLYQSYVKIFVISCFWENKIMRYSKNSNNSKVFLTLEWKQFLKITLGCYVSIVAGYLFLVG